MVMVTIRHDNGKRNRIAVLLNLELAPGNISRLNQSIRPWAIANVSMEVPR